VSTAEGRQRPGWSPREPGGCGFRQGLVAEATWIERMRSQRNGHKANSLSVPRPLEQAAVMDCLPGPNACSARSTSDPHSRQRVPHQHSRRVRAV